MNLIVNADDFGLTHGVNQGIYEGIKNGIVTSCTMVANGEAAPFDEAVKMYQEHQLDVGVHLALTMGRPLLDETQTSSLTDENGDFYRLGTIEEHVVRMDKGELKAEFTAQIDKIRMAGIEVSHLDSHHHVHMLPVVRDVYLEIAKEQNLPVRAFYQSVSGIEGKYCNYPESIIADFYGDGVTEACLTELLASLSGASAEIMCHPAYADKRLMEVSGYNKQREEELRILCSPKIRAAVAQLGINLIGYREFKR